MIHFEALNENHFQLLTEWFNRPHVQAFYSMHDWTLEEVRSKYMPYVRKEKPVNCFVAYLDGTPFAFIQNFAIKDFGWPEQDFTPDMIQKAAGTDLFIGEVSMLHRGLGSELLEAFLQTHVWPHYDFCVVDPELRNVASQRFFHRCGFKVHKTIHTRDTLERDGFVRDVSLVLMTRSAID
jgi:aminoglycoside 6'-N-acetyltransferase